MASNVEDFDEADDGATGLMNPRLLLCDYILRSNGDPGRAASFQACLEEGITDEMLCDQDGSASLWRSMLRFYTASSTKGCIPSREVLTLDYSTIVTRLPNSTACNLLDLCERAKGKYYYREVTRLHEKIAAKLNSPARPRLATLAADTRTAMATLTAKVTKRSSDVVSMSDSATLVEKMLISSKRPVAMPWPWKTLNIATKGIQPAQFTILTAINKTGKTTICLLLAMHLLFTGKRVGFYSKEMDAEVMKQWLLCMFAGVPFDGMTHGFTDEQAEKLREAVQLIQANGLEERIHFTTCQRADGSDGGPAEVEEFITSYAPDVMILDSFYHMVMPVVNARVTESQTASLAAATKELRQVCIRTRCPIIGNMQDLEAKVKKQNDPYSGDATAWHTTAFQDSDNGFRLIASPDRREMTLYIVRARTFRSGFSVTFSMDPNKDYAEVEGGRAWKIGDAEEDTAAESGGVRKLHFAMQGAAARLPPAAESPTSRFSKARTIKDLDT